MSHNKLVYMANQIATFFSTQPEDDKAARVAAHISDFWDPRMRRQLFDMVDAGEAEDLSPLAREAVAHLRQAA